MAFKNILWEGKRVNKLKELFGFAYIISANIYFLNMAFKNILWEGKRVNKLKELFVHQVICYKCLFLFGCGLFGCLLWTLLCDLLCCGFFWVRPSWESWVSWQPSLGSFWQRASWPSLGSFWQQSSWPSSWAWLPSWPSWA